MTKIKLKLRPIMLVVIMAFITVAIKAKPIRELAVQKFYLQPSGNPYNPLHYSTSPRSCEPGVNAICSLDAVSYSEIYSLFESLVQHGSAAFQGKPKVDISTAQIRLDLDYSISYPASAMVFPTGRLIEKRR